MSKRFSIEVLSKYLDGELGESEAKTVEERLAGDAEAQREVEWLRKSRGAVRPTPERMEAIKSNVMAALGDAPWALGAPVVGEVAEVRGAARILRPGATEGIPVVAGFAVRRGDRIVPDEGDVVVLRIDDKGMLRIAEETELDEGTLERVGASWWARNRHWVVGERSRKGRMQLAGLAVTTVMLAIALALLMPGIEMAQKDAWRQATGPMRGDGGFSEGHMPYAVAIDWKNPTYTSDTFHSYMLAGLNYGAVNDRTDAGDILRIRPAASPVKPVSLAEAKPGDTAGAGALTYDPANGNMIDGDAWQIHQGTPRVDPGTLAEAKQDQMPAASYRRLTVAAAPKSERSHLSALQPTRQAGSRGSAGKPTGLYCNGSPSKMAVPGLKKGVQQEKTMRLAFGGKSFLSESLPRQGDALHFSDPDYRINDESLPPAVMLRPEHNTEAYDQIVENPFLDVRQNPLSTFSIDVDTASYANMRRFVNQGQLPPKGSVRIEELINYFSYDYPQPEGDKPFSVNTEVGECPWEPKHRLVKIGLQGRKVAWKDRPASNLVFLLDVSGSMRPANKLPLVKQAISMLVGNLTRRDRVSIVVYAGASGLVLEPTSGGNKQAILEALERLRAGGSTNGGSGIQLAYTIAKGQFIKGGINRVILATDGDFNVGTTNQGELTDLIEKKAKSGVFLTVLGFGMGNLKDSTLEKLADKGNGNYAYIDTESEARKALVEEISGTLITIAKDVKIQVEFNPRRVGSYRLIGYENRMLRAEDFNDDTKDAGEIGAGISVTALYELAPADAEAQPVRPVDPLKYQQPAGDTKAAGSDELLTVKLRYKAPDGDKSRLIESPLKDEAREVADTSKDFRFAASVAAFGMLLRDSQFKGAATYGMVRKLAQAGMGDDPFDYRKEFVILVGKVRRLAEPEE